MSFLCLSKKTENIYNHFKVFIDSISFKVTHLHLVFSRSPAGSHLKWTFTIALAHLYIISVGEVMWPTLSETWTSDLPEGGPVLTHYTMTSFCYNSGLEQVWVFTDYFRNDNREVDLSWVKLGLEQRIMGS